jgi:methanogenic corrinoid protein MtbC1/DNA-binding XRE family transcriptional regulator
LGDLSARYLEALIDADRASALVVVSEGLARGLDPTTLILDVLSPAQAQVGELWHRSELSVSQEHWASEVTGEAMEQVLQAQSPPSALGFDVVVTTVPGESHALPSRALAGLLRWRGWSVDYLGLGPPVADLIEFVRQREPHLVAVSLTVATLSPVLLELCQGLRRLESAPAILVGGAGVAGFDAETLEADAVASDLRDGLDLAARLVGRGPGRNLESYLAVLGGRIQYFRHRQGVSQAELAQRSGLTRPYLSAVEGGRQNITLEVALKIAGGLGMSVARLLDEKPDSAARDPRAGRNEN